MDWVAIAVLSFLGVLLAVFIVFVTCIAYTEIVR